jgi:hypothetical protein
MDSLERWLVREAVRKEVASFLNGETKFDPLSTLDSDSSNNSNSCFPSVSSNESGSSSPSSSTTIMRKLFQRMLDFPPFRGDPRMQKSLGKLLELAPKIDSAMKKQKGSTNLERFLVGLIAAPIVSSKRVDYGIVEEANSQLQGENEATPNSFAHEASMFLEELVNKPQGVAMFVEELKSVHSVNELRPSAQRLLERMRENWAQKLLRNIRKDPRKFRETIRQIPKQTILGALKMHTGDLATSAAIHMVFLRPFGMYSIWQHLVSEIINLTPLISEFQRISSFLSNECTQALDNSSERLLLELGSMAELDQLEDYNHEAELKGRTFVVNFLEKQHGIHLATEPEKWAAVRYLEFKRKKAAKESLVEILGTEEFTRALHQFFSSSKTKLSDSVLSKGSGIVKFVEELFSCLDMAIKEAIAIQDDNELETRFKLLWEQVQIRGLVVMHNILSNDPELVIHETIYWLTGLYKNARNLKLPTMEIIHSLPLEERQKIQNEAETAKAIELENSKREAGSKKNRVQNFPNAARFLGSYSRVLEKELDALGKVTCLKQDLIFTATQSAAVDNLEPILNFGLTLHESQETTMTARGFRKCGSTDSVTLWSRTRNVVPCLDETLGPIVDLKLDHSYRATPGWITIPRNLNKGVFGTSNVFIKYKRATANECISPSHKCLRGIVLLGSANDSLEEKGWTLVGTFSRSLLFETRMYALFQ